MNHAFRSHLMQQFMASARNQARSQPPVTAVCGWFADGGDDDDDEHHLSTRRMTTRLKHHRRPCGCCAYYHSVTTTPIRMLQKSDKTFHNNDNDVVTLSRHDRSFRLPPTEISEIDSMGHHHHPETTTDPTKDTNGASSIASAGVTAPTTSNAVVALLQTLLRTRRTTSHYQYPPYHSAEFYRAAIDRAVLAGRSAPNHKRTEAVSFRHIASLEKINQLAEIAVKVSQNPNKGEKWKRTTTFLVTLVHHGTVQEEEEDDATLSSSTAAEDMYKPMTYIAPTSPLELEDYAAACAATQNVLLSLHSEGLATKWATGPVIQTLAFRRLIDASKTDRIVALIFIGESASSTTSVKRVYRRNFHGDFLRNV